MTLLPVDEARSRLLAMACTVSDVETLPLHLCAGRALAEDLIAKLTQPPFDASAMDGYALRGDDAKLDSRLKLIGESAAGRPFEGAVGSGETVRIFTGAPVPQGADTVLLQEDASRFDDGMIGLNFAPALGRHIRPKGQDFGQGDIVLKKGSLLTPARLMLAAATDNDRLTVLKRPRIGILATGDELVQPGSPRGDSQIIASNTFAIEALARACGAEPIDLGIAGDNFASLDAAIDKAVSGRFEILVTLGGASVGDHDLVQQALKNAGMELDFWKIAMRPGKPLMAGKLGEMVVLGLPGNPVSSLVCGLLFLEPLVSAMSGLPAPRREITVNVTTDLAENDKRRDHLRARLSRAEDGSYLATPFDKQDSSMMRILAEAGCLIIREPYAPRLASGDKTRAILILEPEAL